MANASRIIAGAMSGTSADGVDVALVRISGRGLEMSARLLRWQGRGFSPELKRAIIEIRHGKLISLADLARVGREISLCYAATVNAAPLAAGLSAADLAAVAGHGQTLFHDPPNTIQWLDPALVAAEVGCPVVSDFRRADCAAGGQGAPLVPLADYLLFRHLEKNRLLVNLGGIANVTCLPAGAGIERVTAFDTGPGNCLSDQLMRQADSAGPGWDERGARAAAGEVVEPIVRRMLAAEYFRKSPPKSTDGPAMIGLFEQACAEVGGKYPLESLLRTACAISARAITQAVKDFLPSWPDETIVSGGGTSNDTLMGLFRQALGDVPVRRIEEFGIPSAAKEAMAFALLGAATLDGVPGNVPAATGARRAVVLGSVTPRP